MIRPRNLTSPPLIRTTNIELAYTMMISATGTREDEMGCFEEEEEEEEMLFQMVKDFIESDPNSRPISPSSSNPTNLSHNFTFLSLQDILQKVSDEEVEILEKVLLYLQRDIEDMTTGWNINILNKWIVLRLNIDKYDASLCTTSWVSSFGLSSEYDQFTGGYEYVDVIMGKETRLIVDIDFKSQFELVRPTPTYAKLINALPPVFVGTEDKLDQIISLICPAAKQSLLESGLDIPPWRKSSYMHSKWLSRNCKKDSLFPNEGMPKLVLSLD